MRVWVANGFFWSAPFGMGLGGALSRGGTLVLLPTFDPEKALALIEAERIDCPMGWPHQWAQLAAAPNFASADLSSLRYVHPDQPASDRRGRLAGANPHLRQYRDVHPQQRLLLGYA